MDPKETLELCIEALQQEDYEACFYHAQDLRIWLNKGGLGLGVDKIANSVDLDVWCQVTMKICKQQRWDRIWDKGE